MPEELNKKVQLSNTSNFNFLSNNVKELKSSKKRLKLFQYIYLSQRYLVSTSNTSFESHGKNME